MENNDHSVNDDSTSNSASDYPQFSSTSSHGDGGIFSGSHHFTVAGGTFSNVTKNYTSGPTVPSGNSFFFSPRLATRLNVWTDFRMIPLGDIDLQHEFRLNKAEGSVVVDHRRERTSVCRVYSARIDGRNAPMTVAMYQGPGAEERWRQDIAKQIHPNVVQMFGAASSGGVRATFFHGDLIPYHHFLDLHRHSPILTVYIKGFCLTEFSGLKEYFTSAFQTDLYDFNCTFWIRRSTGQLCADLIPSDFTLCYFWNYGRPTRGMRQVISLNVPNMEAMVIESLTLEEFHAMCAWDLARGRAWTFPTRRTVHFGAVVVSSGSDMAYFDEIVFSSNITSHARWKIVKRPDTNAPGTQGKVTEDGWTRFDSGDVSDNRIQLRLDLRMEQHSKSWLSQANHIFSRLGIASDFTDYALVQHASLNIIISEAVEHPPSGYLFVCPEKDLQTGPSSFKLPDCPAYWSLNPSGAERLSPEEAAELGFPSIRLSTIIYSDRWDTDVYDGLRQFYRAKGFDPDSQDVAQHLGYPLYQLPTAVDPLFAHDSDSQEDNQGPVDIDDEMPVSRTFRFFLNVQGMLFLFLALSWLYDYL
ncbi:hypothetical protein B0H13DRAFT_1880111 [Mycena leptocephala]|nr:hypothetical protein B0H13DRAFT_1880111 [Mycena leptocephala]